MAQQRTRTVKNKHAANKSGIKNSKAARQPQTDDFVKSKGPKKGSKPKQVHASSIAELLKKRKQTKTYTEAELGIPKLNSIRPAGIVKPRGKKKGKIFVDDAVGIHHDAHPARNQHYGTASTGHCQDQIIQANTATNNAGEHADDSRHCAGREGRADRV
jgi:hypothetical protein